MSDVIHATERALLVVRKRTNRHDDLPHASKAFACGVTWEPDRSPPSGHFYDRHAIELVQGRMPERLPTCTHCRVLLDEAWEHPVEVAP